MKVLQVVLALSLLIIIHELGHFLFAKLFHIKVDKFYLFFDAGGFRLFSTKHNPLLTKLFPRLKEADTDYGIGWLPLGGYCKIAGMVDESMDKEQLSREPQPYEFRAHPAWQRLLVLFGGVFFNFIFAILVYICLLSANGTTYISNDGNAIYTNELSSQMGFKTGDRILSYDDYVPENFGMLQADLARRTPRIAKVLRGEDTVKLYIDHSMIPQVLSSPDMFSLAVPFIVDTLIPDSPNKVLRHNDRICSINGETITYVQDSRPLLATLAGQEVEALIEREGSCQTVRLSVDTLGHIGVYTVIPGIKTKEYSFLEAIPAGFVMTFDQIGGYLRDLKLVATPSTGAYKSVGSFIAIGQVFPSSWNWTVFFGIVALLSIMLGVMNLIPIPALDGGHIAITLFEMITGRKPSDRFLMVTQMIGMVLLLMLMFLAFGNDITRLIK